MKIPFVISVGGGKGGIGKSTLLVNLGAALAQRGFAVGFVDADMGGANLHTFLGVKRPRTGLQYFLDGSVGELADVAVDTVVPGTWLISGASDILSLANPHYTQKQKLIRHIRNLNADYIFVDLGAGTGTAVTDFFAAFSHGILVSDGLPTSIENAYGFLKNSIARGILRLFPSRHDIRECVGRFSGSVRESSCTSVDELVRDLEKISVEDAQKVRSWLHRRKTYLVLNMVRERDDIAIGKRFSTMVSKYLGVHLFYIGYIISDRAIRASIKAMKPVVTGDLSSGAKHCIDSITDNLIVLTRGTSAA